MITPSSTERSSVKSDLIVSGSSRSRALRICMVTASPSAGRCGIHDFVSSLARAVQDSGEIVEIVDNRAWNTAGTIRLTESLRKLSPDVVHMQYPMIEGWRSVGPHLSGFLAGAPHIVTLHEFSSFDLLRRASIYAFVWSAKTLALTSEFEACRLLGQFPRAKKKALIIPIGSNIPFVWPTRESRDGKTVVYFGQIKPLKGLEEFIELAQLSTQRERLWKFRIIGAPVTWAGAYLAEMRQRTRSLPIEWSIGLNDQDTAQEIASSDAAYLPYPDGASERRGSLLAALGNGVPVVSTRGAFVSNRLAQCLLFAESPDQADKMLERLFAEPQEQKRFQAVGRAYAAQFSWQSIASQYVAAYSRAAGIAE